ncbi:GIY-YIG nuclease family protein [Bacillus sp. 1P06AnD]|uniref:GIY-YIG nuclease family protein n=1 Tax=Bacillus sp. 1P06AnD TaxID=3132208 RepID=UPI0039A0F980
MDRKKELKQLYKETKIEAGIYRITNKVNDKVFIGRTRNFKTLNGVKFMLENGTFTNKALQEEWNEYGNEAFEFDILETLNKEKNPDMNEKKALELIEEKWIDKLQPFEEHGYHKIK